MRSLLLSILLALLAACEPRQDTATLRDRDGDGALASEDCDDSEPRSYPGATELCNGVDDDCDGEVDERDADDASTWRADADGDGYGDPGVEVVVCDQPTGFVLALDETDCDDADAGIHPGAEEYCDGVDQDCDGEIDEGEALDGSTWYADDDGDGYGDPDDPQLACSRPTGTTGDDTDCDDEHSDAHPGADERCDGYDNDCDGVADEDDAVDALTWYSDDDGDMQGDPDTAQRSCGMPAGTVLDNRDCDDSDPAINTYASERCDGVDTDCDASTGEDGLVSVEGTTTATIQEAIEMAAPGERVLVCDGVYSERLEIAGDLQLVSVSGSASTEIAAPAGGAAIFVASGEVSVAGFALSGGQGEPHPDDSSSTIGGGIFVQSGDPVSLSDCAVSGGEADYGAGLAAWAGASITATDCHFEGNFAIVRGGGLYLVDDASVVMSGGAVQGNEARRGGGGAYLERASSYDCKATDWGDKTDDNLPDDLQLGAGDSYDAYGAGETFSCTGYGGCL